MMMRVAAAVLAAFFLSGAAPDAPVPHVATGFASETAAGLALRSRYGVAAITGTQTIHVRSIDVDQVRREVSTLASRDSAGRWTVSQVVEDRPSRIEINKLYVRRRTLTIEEGARLDGLLASRRLYRALERAPAAMPNAGAMTHAMEIVTPKGHAVMRWAGELRGRPGKVAGLVMGWAEPPPSWEEGRPQELKPLK